MADDEWGRILQQINNPSPVKTASTVEPSQVTSDLSSGACTSVEQPENGYRYTTLGNSNKVPKK